MTPLVVASDQGIVAKLEDFITDYGAIPQQHYALPIALWALATHCFQKFDVFGYLCFVSLAPGAGKTRLLEILECFCCRAQLKVKITLAGNRSGDREGRWPKTCRWQLHRWTG